MTFGYFIILLGLLFLLNNLGFIHGGIGGYILPVFFIFLGGSLLIRVISKKDKSRESE